MPLYKRLEPKCIEGTVCTISEITSRFCLRFYALLGHFDCCWALFWAACSAHLFIIPRIRWHENKNMPLKWDLIRASGLDRYENYDVLEIKLPNKGKTIHDNNVHIHFLFAIIRIMNECVHNCRYLKTVRFTCNDSSLPTNALKCLDAISNANKLKTKQNKTKISQTISMWQEQKCYHK